MSITRFTGWPGRAAAAIIGTVLAASAVAAVPSVAHASPAVARPAATYNFPVRVSANGWITYTNALAPKLGLAGLHTVTVTGHATSSGCGFSATGSVKAGAAGTYTEEVGYNPHTCQAQFETGTVTRTALTKLSGLTGTHSTIHVAQAATQRTAGASRTAAGAAAYTSTSAYQKSAWIDPVDITITSFADDLTWTHNGSAWGTANASDHPYEFAYDGWTNTGTPAIHFSSTTADIGMNESETFYNSDFQAFVIAALGLAAFAACTDLGTTTKYTHNEVLTGHDNGSYSWSYNDTKGGGCANLVHHGNWNGFGSMT